MLKWMRGKRFDLKTSVFILVLALIVWGLFVYANVLDFMPSLRVPAEP